MKQRFDFRKLAAIDIVFLGYKLVSRNMPLVFCSRSLSVFRSVRGHSVWQVMLGTYLICLGINYERNWLMNSPKNGKAMSKYRRLSVFLLVPLLVPVLVFIGD